MGNTYNVGISRKLITASMALFFIICNVFVGQLWVWGIISPYPYWARGMFAIIAVYVLGGCMLQTFGYLRTSRALGIVAFLLLCLCACYSSHLYEYVIFALCMATLLHRMSHTCECIRTQEKEDSCKKGSCVSENGK